MKIHSESYMKTTLTALTTFLWICKNAGSYKEMKKKHNKTTAGRKWDQIPHILFNELFASYNFMTL